MESSTELKQGIIKKRKKKYYKKKFIYLKKKFLTLNRLDSNNSSAVFCFLTSVISAHLACFLHLFLSFCHTVLLMILCSMFLLKDQKRIKKKSLTKEGEKNVEK